MINAAKSMAPLVDVIKGFKFGKGKSAKKRGYANQLHGRYYRDDYDDGADEDYGRMGDRDRYYNDDNRRGDSRVDDDGRYYDDSYGNGDGRDDDNGSRMGSRDRDQDRGYDDDDRGPSVHQLRARYRADYDGRGDDEYDNRRDRSEEDMHVADSEVPNDDEEDNEADHGSYSFLA